MKKLLFILLFLPFIVHAQGFAPNPPQPSKSILSLMDSIENVWINIHDTPSTTQLTCNAEGNAMINILLNDSLTNERIADSNISGHHITPSFIYASYYTKTQSDAKYLQSYTENDPIFSASSSFGINTTNITHWNTAYNKYLIGFGFSNGILTGILNDATTQTVSLDGRYLIYSDTIGLSNRINLKQNYSDTLTYDLTISSARGLYYPLSSNPNNYLTASNISGKINYTDTSTFIATKANINTAQALDVKYGDSTVKYETPSQTNTKLTAYQPVISSSLTGIGVNLTVSVSPTSVTANPTITVTADTSHANNHLATQAFVLNNSGGTIYPLNTVLKAGNISTVSATVAGNNSTANDTIQTTGGTIYIGTESEFGLSAIWNKNSNHANWLIDGNTNYFYGNHYFRDGSGSAVFSLDNAGATFSYLGTGAIYSNAGVLTNTLPSDSTRKDKITPVSFGINQLMKINFYKYHYKSNPENITNYGALAQNVSRIIPELVDSIKYYNKSENNPKDTTWTMGLGLNQQGIDILIAKSVQDMQKEIVALKKEVYYLKKKQRK